MENRVTSIQIKLKDYDADAPAVLEELKELFQNEAVAVNTWEGKQGALLAAISIEKGILNVLLFLIIAVAGFGILAIFSMIVTEKTRDIGILKALGASNGGVMKIFLSYGLLLGMVGSGLGSLIGILLTNNINAVEQWLGSVTGMKIFDESVYYFKEIPTDIQFGTVLMVNIGAVLIALHLVLSQAEPFRHTFRSSKPLELCVEHFGYTWRIERFPFCPPAAPMPG